MAKHAPKSKIPAYIKKVSIPIVMAGVMLGVSGSAYASPELIKEKTVQTAAQKLEVATVAEKIAVPTVQAAVVASSDVKVSFDKPAVTTAPSPERVAAEQAAVLAVKAAEEKAVADAAAAKKAEEQAAAQAVLEAEQAAARAAAPATYGKAAGAYSGSGNASAPAASNAPSNGSIGQRILAAAQAQIGVNQDCTMLVTNSLKAVGINFHGWPAEYKSLGTIVTNPQPGDLIYYVNGGAGPAHIAVYAGNGMAVHGGFEGTTKLFSANVGSGPIYIRVAG